MKIASILALVVLGSASAITGVPARAAAPAEVAPATAPQTVPADLSEITKGLGSADFKVREEAQKKLDGVDYHQLPALRQLAVETEDAGAKAWLQKRLDAIVEDSALNPPPISLEIKDADLTDTVKALATATGVALEEWPPRSNRGGPGGLMRRAGISFTLSAKEQPFWEVYGDLNKQHGLVFQSFDNLRVQQTEPGWRHMVISGPFVIISDSINRTATTKLQNEPGKQVQPEQMMMQCTIAAGTRMQIMKRTSPSFTEIVDDAGNSLLMPSISTVESWDSGGASRSNAWQFSTSLKLPEHPGRKIASAKGSARFVIQTAVKTVVIDDPAKQLNQPITVGARTVMITKFDVKPREINFSVQSTDGAQGQILGAGNDPPAVSLRVLDAQNKVIERTTIQGNMSSGSSGVEFTGPLHIELSVPVKTKELTVPFELKDLPLP